MNEDLVPGRECGPCTVCCSVLKIDTPELRKPPGVTCPNCASGQGCTIYETRPSICRIWFCAWRRLEWIGEALRPDAAGVLIHFTRVEGEIATEFVILEQTGLKAEGLAETVCAAIRDGVPAFLTIPGEPGFNGSRWLLNDAVSDVAERGRHDLVLREMRKLYVSGRFISESGATAPVTMES